MNKPSIRKIIFILITAMIVSVITSFIVHREEFIEGYQEAYHSVASSTNEFSPS